MMIALQDFDLATHDSLQGLINSGAVGIGVLPPNSLAPAGTDANTILIDFTFTTLAGADVPPQSGVYSTPIAALLAVVVHEYAHLVSGGFLNACQHMDVWAATLANWIALVCEKSVNMPCPIYAGLIGKLYEYTALCEGGAPSISNPACFQCGTGGGGGGGSGG